MRYRINSDPLVAGYGLTKRGLTLHFFFLTPLSNNRGKRATFSEREFQPTLIEY
jgi:hypothetical protein